MHPSLELTVTIRQDPRFDELSRLTGEEHWDEAFALLQEMSADHPDDPMLLAVLGTVAEEMQARPVAYDYFRRSLAGQPTDPEVLVLLGAGLARFDDPEAEGVLRLAAITAPDLPGARLQYGAYLAREGQLELALQELGAARELDPGDPAAPRELAVAHWLAGQPALAAESMALAAELGGDDPRLGVLAGLLALAADEPDAAEQMVRTARDEAEDGEAQLVAALAAAEQGWEDEAWEALARAEGSVLPADPEMVGEAEEAIEAGEESAGRLLRDELLPGLLHDRLFDR